MVALFLRYGSMTILLKDMKMYRHILNIKGVSFFGILRFLYKFKGSSCEEELVAMLTKEEQKVLDIEDSRYAHFMINYHFPL